MPLTVDIIELYFLDCDVLDMTIKSPLNKSIYTEWLESDIGL